MSLYLIIDLASISIPLLFSFHPRIAFYKEWRFALAAILFAAIPYLIWDQWFTLEGVWGFNPQYHGTLMVGEMPLEEVLFFICIPYACLFTYWSITKLTNVALPARWVSPLYGLLFVLFAVMVASGYSQLYTLVDGLFGASILLAVFVWKRDLLRRFFPVYIIVLIPFIIVNGLLTGWGIDGQVVWYNDAENYGIRAITIPIEDFAYAFSMLLLSTLLFEVFRSRKTAQA